MSFRLAERLGPADVVSLANAAVGVGAMAAAVLGRPGLVARLLLLAAVADGVDGLVARQYGGSEVGPTLDAMADVVSFGAAPAVFLLGVAHATWPPLATQPVAYGIAIAVAVILACLSLLRSALYTELLPHATRRPGVQNTLLASILAAAYLSGLTDPWLLLGVAAILAVLQVAPISYPKLATRDALAMGAVQVAAIVLPRLGNRALPRALLLAAVAYLLLAPMFYWDEQASPAG